jgi:hypothetical protein
MLCGMLNMMDYGGCAAWDKLSVSFIYCTVETEFKRRKVTQTSGINTVTAVNTSNFSTVACEKMSAVGLERCHRIVHHCM